MIKGFSFLAHYTHVRIANEVEETCDNDGDTHYQYTKRTQELVNDLIQSYQLKKAENDGVLEWGDPTLLHDLGRVQEVYYNLGRAFNSIRMNHLAHYMYENALKLSSDFPQINESPLNLTRECAFNLVQLYKQGGKKDLALQTMRKYLLLD